jgi:hypothetical protein
MQPIVHFLLSAVAGFGVGIHLKNTKKKFLLIFLFALATVAIDLDHLLPIYSENGIAIFHNIFVFILLPAEIFLIFFIYERQKGTTIRQRSCLILSVMFIGAMLTDGISESGMTLFYPLNTQIYGFINMQTTVDPTVFSLTTGQVILILWGMVIMGANILETVIYNDVEGRKVESNSKNIDTKKTRKSWLGVIISGMPIIKLPFNSDNKESK